MLRSVQSLNHIAMPTNNTAETYRFYTEVMGFSFVSAVREERVPSTGEKMPFLHTFFSMADGSCIAFFDIPGTDYAARDDGVPKWIRHFALNVDTYEELQSWKGWLQSQGVPTIGIVDHEGIWQSLYFFDPNGLRLELTFQKRDLVASDRDKGEQLLKDWIEEFGQRAAPTRTGSGSS